MAPRKSPTKHDVALAEIARKARREAILFRGLVAVAVILALYLPISALQGIVEPLAGKTTKVDVNVVVSIAVALSLALNGFQYLKGRSRRNELKRQRDRIKTLEGTALMEAGDALAEADA
jgi:type IV secretory pathway TrbD component